jgi:hypothetical protein
MFVFVRDKRIIAIVDNIGTCEVVSVEANVVTVTNVQMRRGPASRVPVRAQITFPGATRRYTVAEAQPDYTTEEITLLPARGTPPEPGTILEVLPTEEIFPGQKIYEVATLPWWVIQGWVYSKFDEARNRKWDQFNRWVQKVMQVGFEIGGTSLGVEEADRRELLALKEQVEFEIQQGVRTMEDPVVVYDRYDESYSITLQQFQQLLLDYREYTNGKYEQRRQLRQAIRSAKTMDDLAAIQFPDIGR